MEVFRDWLLVPEIEVESRRLSRLELNEPLELADCTASAGRRFGITAEIHSSTDYAATQRWAAAFAAAGFDGIRYFVRHDPGQTLAGVALFGPVGSAALPAGELLMGTLGLEILEDVQRRFGIQILPTP